MRSVWAKSGHSHLILFFLCFFEVSALNRTRLDVGVILDKSSWIGNVSLSCMPMAVEDFYTAHPNYNTRLNLHLRDSGNTTFGAAAAVRALNRTRLDVGVILDKSSWIGNVSWSCMPMAVEDFYTAHPNYNTRLNLHLRDSGNTTFGAAAAALDLLKNVQVQTIIGPQTSIQAKFVVELGDKTQVPIISFSAKSPSISHQRSQYFIRTGLNDSIQAQVIASIMQSYNWKEIVPIFEDTDYGNGLVPYLVDSFQDVGARVPYKSSLPLSATKNQIIHELKKLKNMQTRVFIVHMSYSLGLQLFSTAKELGMMKEGYVWITTYGLTDVVDLVGPLAAEVMQGVLGIKPYVKETSKLHEFKLRWAKKFAQANPDAKLSEPTVFGLWAYDTVWSLALSAERAGVNNSTFEELNSTNKSTGIVGLGSSGIGPALLNNFLDTNFDGMSGKFDIIDGQLDLKPFEIINVVGQGKKRVGFWTPSNSISASMNSKGEKLNITWPGGKTDVPKGWEWPIETKKLRVGIPVKQGFPKFVHFVNNTAQGYCIKVFDAVMAQMPYEVHYKYIPFKNSTGDMNGTYDDLVYQVYLQNFDAVVGDITIIANRSLYVDFTLPYTESGVAMLVPVKDQRRKGAWAFLKPLTTDLWLSSGAFFVFTGFVVWLLEHRINDDFRGSTSNQLGTVLYFAFSTLVFSHREKVLSNLSRVVVIIWVFVVLVLQSSYTASLTSLLTVQQLQPTVTDINELVKTGAYVGYLDDSFMPHLLKRLNFNESKLIAYQSIEDYNAALSNGTVAAIFDEIPYLKVFLSKYCNKYTMTGPTYKTDGFGFVFPRGSLLVPDVSRAVLNITEGAKMAELENELYGQNSCPDLQVSDTSSSSLRLDSFKALFLITGIASFTALIIDLAFFAYKNQAILKAHDSGSFIRKKLSLLAKLYFQMNPTCAPKKQEDLTGEPVTDDTAPPLNFVSEPHSPFSISVRARESFEIEVEGTTEDGLETPADETPGREISRENRDPPSFADMLTERT